MHAGRSSLRMCTIWTELISPSASTFDMAWRYMGVIGFELPWEGPRYSTERTSADHGDTKGRSYLAVEGTLWELKIK